MPRVTKGKENVAPKNGKAMNAKTTATKAKKAPVKHVTKGKKEKKDPNAPKRATTSYMFFCKDKRAEVQSENPDEKLGGISKIMGAMWRELPASKRNPYVVMATKDKERYAEEKEAYDARTKGDANEATSSDDQSSSD